MFQQSNAPSRTALLSETQLGQSAGGPSQGPTNGQPTSRFLGGLENGRIASQDSSRLDTALVNGHAAAHAALSEPNNGSSKTQTIASTRTENHQIIVRRPKTSMTRSKTTYEPENFLSIRDTSVEEHAELRHGWEDQYNSSEFLGQLNSVFSMYHLPDLQILGRLTLSPDFLHVLHGQAA